MADRVIGLGNTLNEFRTELNGTAADVGDIQDLLDATGYIASSTDLVEAVVAINAEVDVVREVNSLKNEMREIKDLLREIKDGR